MEIAHIQTGALRVLAKLFLLIVLVFLLAKVLLALLVLAVVGGVTFCCARAIYNRRDSLQRLARRTVGKLVGTVGAILQVSIGLLPSDCQGIPALGLEDLPSFLVQRFAIPGGAPQPSRPVVRIAEGRRSCIR